MKKLFYIPFLCILFISCEKQCPVCKGTGEVLQEEHCPDSYIFHGKCYACDGKGNQGLTCTECDDDGNINCYKCMGTGTIGKGSHKIKCSSCDGKKKVMCMSCFGSTIARCKTCNGVGNYKCKKCDGHGWIKQKVKCAKCDGKGKI